MKYYTAPNMSKHVACVLIVKDNQELLSKNIPSAEQHLLYASIYVKNEENACLHMHTPACI